MTMSMDAGGLAQMTYNNNFNNGTSLGVPGSGFASRGKGSHIKRLSMPPQVATIDESQPSASISTPRTSRSHLLAGLRTAPRSATIPSNHQQQPGMDSGRFAGSKRGMDRVPQTATGAGFPQHRYSSNHGMNTQQNRPVYTLPEQVLAPPTFDDSGIDENMYAELMSTNLFLAAQQQRLQQQLINVTAAAQQFQGLTLGGMSLPQQQAVRQAMPSLNMNMSGIGFYQQQLQQGVQPIVQPVHGQPGLFCVYNPLTGQQSYIMDNSAQENGSPQPYEHHSSTQQVPQFRAEISPPADSHPSPMYFSQPISPPSGTPSPPVESANAFRRNHRKNTSFNPALKTNIDITKANVGYGPRSAALPPTPATGTFGPGQARAGEHPVRQPRGPPSLEDLVAKPTSNHEGSKNFATRQRRRAVHNLVRAGIERRGDSRSYGYNSSGGTNTPASEKEFTFSDGDDATVRSGSLSSKPSLGSLRAAANGAIGSERKEKTGRDRNSLDSPYSSATPTSEDGYFGSKFTDVHADHVPSPTGTSSPSVAAVVAGQGQQPAQAPERRKTPMLVLSSAEKRKTPIM
ncbi:uncharacterized protein N7498_006912 [Penicillium cinerascens]|uniref:Uncharacterized protein n=1 Tax=Penicillium cinerascens TaxID=70096 RepID=A0A9W9JIV5_9EURO|nr:uncharacterized protein N7498_006912 [Penicillium cinerascens]KAJ5197795.1 hypothetical protein N7498_006912 [Penicillium cinerascens]